MPTIDPKLLELNESIQKITPSVFAIQTEASFANVVDEKEFERVKNEDGCVEINLGYPLKSKAWIHSEGRIIVKIYLTQATISHYNVQIIANKLMAKAFDDGILQIESSIKIPNEFWLISEVSALGYKINLEKIKNSRVEDLKFDEEQNTIFWHCEQRKASFKAY